MFIDIQAKTFPIVKKLDYIILTPTIKQFEEEIDEDEKLNLIGKEVDHKLGRSILTFVNRLKKKNT